MCRSIVSFLGLALMAAGLVLAAPDAALGQDRGTIAGSVLTAGGAPAADARVTLVGARRRAEVGADGSFRFENLPPGSYLVQAESPRSGIAVERIELAPGEVVERELVLDLVFHAEAITVTTGDARGLGEVYQPASVLGGRELLARQEPTLGETLADEPGVSSTYFGPGASRPVIRGLGGDRVRILEGGVGTGDASNTSPDHAVGLDPLGAERVEIVRGPATLLYGSTAIGGVVNVIDGRIPRFRMETPFSGTLQLTGGTVADERAGQGSVSGGVGNLAWHVGIVGRETEDLSIPGFAESAAFRAAEEAEEGEEGEEEEEVFGTLENSATETTSWTGGVSIVGNTGFVGIAFSRYDDLYGVPGHHEEEGEEPLAAIRLSQEGEEEEFVSIDLEQRRVDVEGELERPLGFLRGLRFRLGTNDYEHVELEGAEVGTRFTNDAWEARVEAPHGGREGLSGAVGLQFGSNEFAAIGEEAFVPPSETDSWAVFGFEEIPAGPVRFQLGARYENQDVATLEGERLSRSLDGLSASAGLLWPTAPDLTLSVSLSRSVRLPTSNELFANGPHLATRAFEVGDPDLDNETSVGLDVGLRRSAGLLSGEVGFFTNWYSDFIFEQFTGEEEDGLQVIRFSQADARFTGFEARADVELLHREPHHVALEVSADYVRGELTDGDEPLPRIPPLRLGVGAHYQGEPFWGEIHVRRASEQDRVAEFETPTDAYSMLDATIGYRFFTGGLVHDLILRGTNLTDEEGRNHVSFLKDLAPLPGRDVSLAYRLNF
ncbi:MAG TPA: TonB-dependent receptor [Gemmatimonadota bacterium]|nr:TonB-dependent receptor [Gemmatimonadota bacterium]